MTAANTFPEFRDDVYARALDARDARFDGVFFVGVTTTHIYCRPVCPSRISSNFRRRFFASAAAAESAGFRPCLRCRPELAPGRALIDSVPRLAAAAAHRIAAGALNERTVADLAQELGVSERHLRRSLEREIGVSPVGLAQTHRLLLAKRLLTDTALSVTKVAYSSGFQSLRRFNALFLEQYRMPPSAFRRARSSQRVAESTSPHAGMLRLTLTYRAPFAWDALLRQLKREAIEGVEAIDGDTYRRTIEINDHRGVVHVEDASHARTRSESVGSKRSNRMKARHLNIDVTSSLLPVLMPLLARLRHIFDLDAEPEIIDNHLTQCGLEKSVSANPGLRVLGYADGFEGVLRTLLGHRVHDVVRELGAAAVIDQKGLVRLVPGAGRVIDAGAAGLVAAGVPLRRAEAIVSIAELVVARRLVLEPGSDVARTHDALAAIPTVGDVAATVIVMRSLSWPDAFPMSDRALGRATGVSSASALRARSERWRPWRAYAVQHLQWAR